MDIFASINIYAWLTVLFSTPRTKSLKNVGGNFYRHPIDMKHILTFIGLLTFSVLTYGQNSSTIYTTDIDNFWQAYDSVRTTKDTVKQLYFIQTLYLDKASDGLKDFIYLREHSSKLHLDNILKYPKFWNSVRQKTLDIKNHIKEIEGILEKFSILYDNYKPPKIYFTIGVLNSGGTTSPGKILIGSEIACADKDVDASELSKWLQGVFKLNTNIVAMVAHELVHTQQKDGDRNSNLLGHSIREGACDFIAELIYKPISSPYMTYGNANEQYLWTEFKKEMYGQETKNWLYNGDNAPNGVADLGYFIGYKICQSYYNNARNKRKALKEIIELTYEKKQLNKFLKKSKYNGGE
ncbi:MAG: hypothetical protein IRZ03_08845 [Acidobacterium ailaaui]|nr:hypothetical protein [Pseudacidobacterium ailaaui]